MAYVSGGSNLDAERNLLLAARALKAAFPGAHFSHCYRNQAIGFEGPDFINFVAALPVAGGPRELKEALERIELLCGREREAPKWAPRSMDLDTLLFGDHVEPALKLPRPDLLRWAFMLGPLAEIAPEAMHPLERRSAGELWRAFDQGAHKLEREALDLNVA
jgi:2-amino-4-hydroxy-6-hydroxymethyldihydropteridine diphosphokinase